MRHIESFKDRSSGSGSISAGTSARIVSGSSDSGGDITGPTGSDAAVDSRSGRGRGRR